MCSILIFSKPDNDHPDPAQDWKKFKRGDVIDMNDDDHFFWGGDIQGPKALGWWRVVVLPGVAAKTLRGLQAGDLPSVLDPQAPVRLRVNKIDLDALETMAKDARNLAVVPDQFDTAKLATDTSTLLSVRATKPALATSLVLTK